MAGSKKSDAKFSPSTYRRFNHDLHHLDDVELSEHLHSHRHELRIYGETSSTVEFLSMRWLRGNGLEIGAGGYPTPMFGSARALQYDCDKNLVFGGMALDFQGSIDDRAFAALHVHEFDFVVASHVLEHVDSFISAIENCCTLVRPGGIVYIILPDIEFLNDKHWLPFCDFAHHVLEYTDSLAYAAMHDRAYIEGTSLDIDNQNQHVLLSPEYRAAVKSGRIPAEQRFMHHKHNYELGGWIDLLQQTRAFLGNRFKVVDLRYGHERLDCHFVLKPVNSI